MIKRDGLAKIIDQTLKGRVVPNYLPTISYLKAACLAIENPTNDSELCMESYAVGFLSCFNLFRLQIEADDMDLDDIEAQIQKLEGWILYLEEENLRLKDQLEKIKDDLD